MPRLKINPAYKAGDLIGFSSHSCVGLWVNVGTLGVPFWSLSHAGQIVQHPEHPLPLLFEATSLIDQPCCLTGKITNGVQAHPIRSRIKGYRGKVWHYPLSRGLSGDESASLTQWWVSNLGVDYDYFGALFARTLALGWLRHRLCSAENLRSLFCSESTAGALRRCGRLKTRNASRWSPNVLSRHLLREGILAGWWRRK